VNVDDAWQQQRKWTALANGTRRQLDRWRSTNLCLVVGGAVLGVIATQTVDSSRPLSTVFGTLSAGALALAGFIQRTQLTAARVEQWKTARAAAESLNSVVHQFLVGVAPFAGPDSRAELTAKVRAVRERARSYEKFMLMADGDGKPVPVLTGIAEYVTGRAEQQRTWHIDRVKGHQSTANRLRWAELVATAVAAVLAGVGGILHIGGLAAWISVATTVSAAISAHLASTQHERIATGYASTAGDLADLLAGFDVGTAGATEQARFVADVERVLAAQNDGWASIITHS
jgi:hypothetical protein